MLSFFSGELRRADPEERGEGVSKPAYPGHLQGGQPHHDWPDRTFWCARTLGSIRRDSQGGSQLDADIVQCCTQSGGPRLKKNLI